MRLYRVEFLHSQGHSRPGRASSKSGHVRCALKAEVNLEHLRQVDGLLWVDGAARDVIDAPKLEPWIVRYELSDFEWAAIKPFLPNKSRGVRRVNDRRVLNGIFWVLRSGAPWRDLPLCYGPRTTCYNRFVRWRKAGVWDRIMDSLAAAHDATVQMIDTLPMRVDPLVPRAAKLEAIDGDKVRVDRQRLRQGKHHIRLLVNQ